MKQQQMPAWFPWLMWGLGAAFFFLQYFARVAPNVMTHELMASLNTHAAGLGILSSSFYWAYVSMQMPVGLLFDSLDAKRLLVMTSLLCALGAFLFGHASGLGAATLGRFLIGFGAAFTFVGAMTLAAMWFSKERMGLLAGLTQAVGMLGAAVGEAPVTRLMDAFGWRGTMMVIVVLFVALAVLFQLLIRTRSRLSAADIPVSDKEKSLNLLQVLKAVVMNRRCLVNALYGGFAFAPMACFSESWGVSFLQSAYGLDNHHAAFDIGLAFIGMAVGSPTIGWLSDRYPSRKGLMRWMSCVCLVVLSLILYAPELIGAHYLPVALFLLGFGAVGVVLAYAMATELVASEWAATSLALANMVSVLVGMLCIPVVGALVEWHWSGQMQAATPLYTVSDYRVALSILPVALLVAIVLPRWIDTPSRD